MSQKASILGERPSKKITGLVGIVRPLLIKGGKGGNLRLLFRRVHAGRASPRILDLLSSGSARVLDRHTHKVRVASPDNWVPLTVPAEAGEMSFESPEIQNGFFTHEVLEALSSSLADLNRNGRISVDELEAFVSLNVALMTGGLQRPAVDRDNINQRFSFPLLH
jgi:hypothetical protein